MWQWSNAVQNPSADFCGIDIFTIVYILKQELIFLCNEQNVGSFQQNSEAVKASTGGADKVSFWFTLKVLVRHFLRITWKRLTVQFLSIKLP